MKNEISKIVKERLNISKKFPSRLLLTILAPYCSISKECLHSLTMCIIYLGKKIIDTAFIISPQITRREILIACKLKISGELLKNCIKEIKNKNIKNIISIQTCQNIYNYNNLLTKKAWRMLCVILELLCVDFIESILYYKDWITEIHLKDFMRVIELDKDIKNTLEINKLLVISGYNYSFSFSCDKNYLDRETFTLQDKFSFDFYKSIDKMCENNISKIEKILLSCYLREKISKKIKKIKIRLERDNRVLMKITDVVDFVDFVEI